MSTVNSGPGCESARRVLVVNYMKVGAFLFLMWPDIRGRYCPAVWPDQYSCAEKGSFVMPAGSLAWTLVAVSSVAAPYWEAGSLTLPASLQFLFWFHGGETLHSHPLASLLSNLEVQGHDPQVIIDFRNQNRKS
jgi:hypothetical protein